MTFGCMKLRFTLLQPESTLCVSCPARFWHPLLVFSDWVEKAQRKTSMFVELRKFQVEADVLYVLAKDVMRFWDNVSLHFEEAFKSWNILIACSYNLQIERKQHIKRETKGSQFYPWLHLVQIRTAGTGKRPQDMQTMFGPWGETFTSTTTNVRGRSQRKSKHSLLKNT